MIVVKHRRRTQELQRTDRSMSQNVRNGDPFPTYSDLDEYYADLRQRRVGEGGFGICACPADHRAMYGCHHTNDDHQSGGQRGLYQQGLNPKQEIRTGVN